MTDAQDVQRNSFEDDQGGYVHEEGLMPPPQPTYLRDFVTSVGYRASTLYVTTRDSSNPKLRDGLTEVEERLKCLGKPLMSQWKAYGDPLIAKADETISTLTAYIPASPGLTSTAAPCSSSDRCDSSSPTSSSPTSSTLEGKDRNEDDSDGNHTRSSNGFSLTSPPPSQSPRTARGNNNNNNFNNNNNNNNNNSLNSNEADMFGEDILRDALGDDSNMVLSDQQHQNAPKTMEDVRNFIFHKARACRTLVLTSPLAQHIKVSLMGLVSDYYYRCLRFVSVLSSRVSSGYGSLHTALLALPDTLTHTLGFNMQNSLANSALTTPIDVVMPVVRAAFDKLQQHIYSHFHSSTSSSASTPVSPQYGYSQQMPSQAHHSFNNTSPSAAARFNPFASEFVPRSPSSSSTSSSPSFPYQQYHQQQQHTGNLSGSSPMMAAMSLPPSYPAQHPHHYMQQQPFPQQHHMMQQQQHTMANSFPNFFPSFAPQQPPQRPGPPPGTHNKPSVAGTGTNGLSPQSAATCMQAIAVISAMLQDRKGAPLKQPGLSRKLYAKHPHFEQAIKDAGGLRAFVKRFPEVFRLFPGKGSVWFVMLRKDGEADGKADDEVDDLCDSNSEPDDDACADD